jgi:hypothetical protein
MTPSLHLLDLIGLAGVVGYISAYFLVQIQHRSPVDPTVVLLNIAGAVCLLASLSASFNLASFLSQALWLVLTLAGWWRRRAPATAS